MSEPPRVEVRSPDAPSRGSAAELAAAFGAAVLEPTWWPEDIGEVGYHLDGPPRPVPMYRIGTARRDGRPIVVIGRLQRDGDPLGPLRGISGLDWRAVPELEPLQCLISNERDAVRAVLMRDDQTVQLIGYMSEDEILRAIRSLRLVSAAA